MGGDVRLGEAREACEAWSIDVTLLKRETTVEFASSAASVVANKLTGLGRTRER